MPDGLSIHDQMAYTSLRSLYHDYHEKRMDRATASAEKRRIFGAWDRAKRTAEFERKLAFFHARLYKDTEMAKTAVRKDPSPENAIRLCNVLDGLEKYRPAELLENGYSVNKISIELGCDWSTVKAREKDIHDNPELLEVQNEAD